MRLYERYPRLTTEAEVRDNGDRLCALIELYAVIAALCESFAASHVRMQFKLWSSRGLAGQGCRALAAAGRSQCFASSSRSTFPRDSSILSKRLSIMSKCLSTQSKRLITVFK